MKCETQHQLGITFQAIKAVFTCWFCLRISPYHFTQMASHFMRNKVRTNKGRPLLSLAWHRGCGYLRCNRIPKLFSDNCEWLLFPVDKNSSAGLMCKQNVNRGEGIRGLMKDTLRITGRSQTAKCRTAQAGGPWTVAGHLDT